MTKAKRNGAIWKVVIGASVTLFVAALTFIINASWKAAGVVKDVEANTFDIVETKTEIKEEIRPNIVGNRESVIGIKKDIERLDGKMIEFNTSQQAMRTEQQKAFKEILERLP